MGTAQMLENLIIVAIFLYLGAVLSRAVKYFKLKVKYGKTNAKGMFWANFKAPFLVPDRKSKRYKDWSSTLLSAAVDVSVERFYTLKYTLAVVAMVALLAVHLTNEDVKVSLILQNMNMSRNIYEHIDFDRDFINKESELVKEVEEYLKKVNIEFADNYQITLNSLEYRIEQAGLTQTAETAHQTAERILNKAIAVNDLKKDMMPFVYILIAAALVFKIPDFLVIIKLTLVEKKKD